MAPYPTSVIGFAALSSILLGACAPVNAPPSTGAVPALASPLQSGPPLADTDKCWDKTVTPAVIETTSERVLISPAETSVDGIIRQPARYEKEDRQTILTPRQESWYQIICSDEMTPEFIATLQRALMARGQYTAPVSATLDLATRDAIAQFQASQNLPGDRLTLIGAQRLGLVPATRS